MTIGTLRMHFHSKGTLRNFGITGELGASGNGRVETLRPVSKRLDDDGELLGASCGHWAGCGTEWMPLQARNAGDVHVQKAQCAIRQPWSNTIFKNNLKLI